MRLMSIELAVKGLQCGEWKGDVHFHQIHESGNCAIWSLRTVVEENIQENMVSREMDPLPQEEIQAGWILMT